MSAPSQNVRLFIGSSSEGREVARNLQEELGHRVDVVRWDQGVFEPGGYTLDSLLGVAAAVDFAVLVATPDDTTVSRGETMPSARDNIVLEFGLFVGALGRNRTFLLPTGDLKLPTDVLGLTRLPFQRRADGNLRAAPTTNGARPHESGRGPSASRATSPRHGFVSRPERTAQGSDSHPRQYGAVGDTPPGLRFCRIESRLVRLVPGPSALMCERNVSAGDRRGPHTSRRFTVCLITRLAGG